jgi:DNA-binding phage protein
MLRELTPRCGGARLLPPSPKANPIFHWMYEEVTRQQVSMLSVAKRAGFDVGTIRSWWAGKTSPTLADVQAVVNALGYKMVVAAEETHE